MLAFLLLWGCAGRLPDTSHPESGTYRVPTDIYFNLSNRDFLLHVPPDIAGHEPLPLVVVLHGAFSTAQQTETETDFSNLADREKFLVAYPEGIGIFGWLQHWNAGHCCGKAAKDDIDDMAYIATVIERIQDRFVIDPERIYMAGMSNGGMMTYRYAAERGDQLAAIAVVSAPLNSQERETTAWSLPEPVAPLPVIAFHGKADVHIPFAGGTSPLKGGSRSFSSFDEAMTFWRRAADCKDTDIISELRHGTITRTDSLNCGDGVRIEFYALEGWEHQWPAPYFTSDLATNEPLYDYNATEIIWKFFRQFERSNRKQE